MKKKLSDLVETSELLKNQYKNIDSLLFDGENQKV